MEHAVLNENRLKEIFKSALIEVIEERRSLFSELLAEVLEDIALIRAIKEILELEFIAKAISSAKSPAGFMLIL